MVRQVRPECLDRVVGLAKFCNVLFSQLANYLLQEICYKWLNFVLIDTGIRAIGLTLDMQAFTLLHYITSFHTPITPTVTNGASTNSFKFSKCELKKVSFQKFFDSISVCEFLETEENSTPLVRRTRNSARRILVSTVEVHIGSCWRISVSHDQAGQRRVSSCPTGTQDCDQLAPGA